MSDCIKKRSTTIPVHGNAEIGGWLFREILKQLGISEKEFDQLKALIAFIAVRRYTYQLQSPPF
ncbi:type II toxin-antitoxin system HicA family toxin [Moorena sp. SIO4A1]|uniref:type II toxin-antitoxin system HicA family toxin n=1 Tax=Moorena sp. SIO4A1 TaxID=2607835 RepID=UPI0025DE0BAA|nr:type II toxin-antitoxin system HicA family toxin [Moorena sp. SIO4A1]